jgi:hypothetical protein
VKRRQIRASRDTISAVNRAVVVIAAAGLALGAAAALFFQRSRERAPETRTPVVAERRVPARDAGPAPAPSAPPSAAPAPERAPAKRAPAAKSAPPPAAPVADAPPTTATLVITSDVPGAQVFLDRAFVGATPARATDVKPGSHQLNVSVPGYDAHVETIEVEPGQREIAIKFREVRLDLSLAVVHKHRMGSCRGRLVATAQGLRYDTTDKDDAFAAGLLDLETFQMDYLSKNLRVQPRKGKRYDFTDPDGNADRLFVFHRDVEKARERLKKGDSPAGQ